MAWIESLQKAIDYMEEHLIDDLSIENIAKQANVSAFHFQRTFTILTDITVGEYIRRRRLTLAAQELSSKNEKIINLAFKYGYDTPEAFTKAFRRQHGVSPSHVRKGLGELKSYNRMIIQVNLKGVDPMNYRVVEKKAFKVVGVKRAYSFENGENLTGIPKFWDDVNTDGTCDQLFELNTGQIKGVLGVCVDQSALKPKTMDYWVATEVDGKEETPFDSLDIPAAKWAVFEVHGPMPGAIQKVWQQVFSEWFPSSGYEHAEGPELEVYSPGNPSDANYYSEVWIPVK
ncbi:AraC family transcriptional regulator [Pullulanibacillus pueri]|uniref:AraC family transcriptional regulator n=1 Tax=Pullulanibacillus pueri TaxID=1437324 RepID=A0A8J3ENX2_9BACL|nr:AraC family transcriptional regulator [Pullulanibacillus pueri]MBM7683889.1 AraC family transcriptional regulator [Pullulanibacillus pueri]GGH87868.1 AraC family transcriptional regulator [Pullulanibacillus pueri]